MKKLSDIVNEFLFSESLGESDYIKAYTIAKRGLSTLQKEVLINTKTKIVDVNSDNTVDFPKEAYKVTRVGVLGSNGEVKALTVNSNIGTVNQELCNKCRCSRMSCECENGFGRATMSSSLGIGSWNNIGEYNIRGRKIYLSPNSSYCEVVVEYPAVHEQDGDICVDPLAEEALLAYLRWKMYQGKRNIGTYEKRDMLNEYKSERRKLKLMKHSHSRQELQQGARQTTKLGI